jgi:hypothetical protein
LGDPDGGSGCAEGWLVRLTVIFAPEIIEYSRLGGADEGATFPFTVWAVPGRSWMQTSRVNLQHRRGLVKRRISRVAEALSWALTALAIKVVHLVERSGPAPAAARHRPQARMVTAPRSSRGGSPSQDRQLRERLSGRWSKDASHCSSACGENPVRHFGPDRAVPEPSPRRVLRTRRVCLRRVCE